MAALGVFRPVLWATFVSILAASPVWGQAPPPVSAGGAACVGSGGLITFDPPLTATVGSGEVHLAFACTGTCAPDPCGGIVGGFDGTYNGDCQWAVLHAPNWMPGEMNLWGGRLIQFTGGPVYIPNFAVVGNYESLLVPADPCNQSATGVALSTFVFVGACMTEPGNTGCG